MDRDQYYAFVQALATAELSPIKDFEEDMYFEGCLPVETIARRGPETLRFGPMKPVGLPDPRTGEEPYAVVQLRQDDAEGHLFNLVGFQTRLKWGEQRRVFRMIPGMENVEFARMGVMHRNTYLPSNRMLEATMRIRDDLDARPLFFAGQLTGVEGYVESAAMGHIAGANAARLARGEELVTMPRTTMMGALANYITTKEGTLQPINSNWGLVPAAPKRENGRRLSKPERRERQAEMALAALEEVYLEASQLVSPPHPSAHQLVSKSGLIESTVPKTRLRPRTERLVIRSSGKAVAKTMFHSRAGS